MLLVIVLLIVAALTGVLWTVLKIAAGVALGIFLGGVLLAAGAFYLVRRQMRRQLGDRRYRSPDRF